MHLFLFIVIVVCCRLLTCQYILPIVSFFNPVLSTHYEIQTTLIESNLLIAVSLN